MNENKGQSTQGQPDGGEQLPGDASGTGGDQTAPSQNADEAPGREDDKRTGEGTGARAGEYS